ncbi:MAG: hypothetical protein R3C02_21560 [Planctomycetaceae bacterium]
MIPHLRTMAFGVAFLSFVMSHAVIAKEPVLQVRIGAKAFTESVVLAEVLAHLAAAADAKAETITLGEPCCVECLAGR